MMVDGRSEGRKDRASAKEWCVYIVGLKMRVANKELNDPTCLWSDCTLKFNNSQKKIATKSNVKSSSIV